MGRWDEARVGFFPLYPLLVDVADRCLPGHEVVAALMVNLVLGAAFVALVGLLAKAWFGFGIGPVIFLVTISAIFPILLNVAAGMRTTWTVTETLRKIYIT